MYGFGNNGGPALMNDGAALMQVQGQSLRINQRVYETRYPEWNFSSLVYVDETGPEWSPGVLTFTSDWQGKAKWQAGGAKDIPLADVTQAGEVRTISMAAIGYQYNLEEVNTVLNIPGASLDARRAMAARAAYQKFMWDLTVIGAADKGLTGVINAAGVTPVAATADGTSSARAWVSNAGVGLKTPALILRDINQALSATATATAQVDFADTLLLPFEAYQYIATTPFDALSTMTILEWVRRNNVYTATTGQPLTIRSLIELRTAATGGHAGKGRLVAYRNNERYLKLHLPMRHRFLPVYQDGPLNFVIPGIFRTGGVEFTTVSTIYFLDAILDAPA